jgi:hypothetical protein
MSNVAVGAVFGATSYVVCVLAGKGISAMLPLSDPKATQTTRVVVGLAKNLLGMLGGFFALKAIGVTLTAAVIVNLTVSAFINTLILHLIFNCFCAVADKLPANPVPPESSAPQVRV